MFRQGHSLPEALTKQIQRRGSTRGKLEDSKQSSQDVAVALGEQLTTEDGLHMFTQCHSVILVGKTNSLGHHTP